MTFVVQRQLKPGQVPVHVLIVVVGQYLDNRRDLSGAGAFGQEIVDFWLAPNRLFPANQLLASVRVLASDPASQVTIAGDGNHVVDPPTFDNVRTELLAWAEQIREAGIGFLHWVGHGGERLRLGGGITNLACHGPIEPNSRDQAAIDWVRSLNVLDRITTGRSVYCFIDACRRPDLSQREYEGIGACDLRTHEGAYVFRTTAALTPAFWVTRPTSAARQAGCNGQAMGTRAFMAGLDGFGARFEGRLPMSIAPAELVEAAQAFMIRWARHQGLAPGRPCGPPGAEVRPLILTNSPRTVVDVARHGASCEAREDGSAAITAAENGPNPFEFRLARKRHSFRCEDGVWGVAEELFHPHMRL